MVVKLASVCFQGLGFRVSMHSSTCLTIQRYSSYISQHWKPVKEWTVVGSLHPCSFPFTHCQTQSTNSRTKNTSARRKQYQNIKELKLALHLPPQNKRSHRTTKEII